MTKRHLLRYCAWHALAVAPALSGLWALPYKGVIPTLRPTGCTSAMVKAGLAGRSGIKSVKWCRLEWCRAAF